MNFFEILLKRNLPKDSKTNRNDPAKEEISEDDDEEDDQESSSDLTELLNRNRTKGNQRYNKMKFGLYFLLGVFIVFICVCSYKYLSQFKFKKIIK